MSTISGSRSPPLTTHTPARITATPSEEMAAAAEPFRSFSNPGYPPLSSGFYQKLDQKRDSGALQGYPESCKSLSYKSGGGGTRTHIRFRAPVFKTGSLANSDTPPGVFKDGRTDSEDQSVIWDFLPYHSPRGGRYTVHRGHFREKRLS